MTAPENAQGVHGMVAVKSANSVKVTIDKYEAAVKARNMNVIARVDHAAAATKIGKTLRPTEILIWGNPASGTSLMQCAQTVGLDLPQKAFAWQDAKGDVYLGWNDVAHLVSVRHVTSGCEAVTATADITLRMLAKIATD